MTDVAVVEKKISHNTF